MTNTDALQQALSEVWSGADQLDALAVADQLHDLGFRVTQKPVKRRAAKVRDMPPMASTRGLPKMRTTG